MQEEGLIHVHFKGVSDVLQCLCHLRKKYRKGNIIIVTWTTYPGLCRRPMARETPGKTICALFVFTSPWCFALFVSSSPSTMNACQAAYALLWKT